MDKSVRTFPEVTLLVTHYNRSASLARLLQAFRTLNCAFGGIVVSDDASQSSHQNTLHSLQKEFGFELISSEKNRGLGNNINKGQDAVRTSYTLYIQEDFVPKPGFASALEDALQLLSKDQGLDVVRFYAYFPYPYTTPITKEFSMLHFKASPFYGNHLKFYAYSDHPHLRRSNFFEKFGRYPEGIKGDETEFGMALSFLKSNGKALLYNDFTGVIDQVNDAQEPSTMQRSSWRESRHPVALLLRAVYLKYRLVKNTLQFAFFKKPKPDAAV